MVWKQEGWKLVAHEWFHCVVCDADAVQCGKCGNITCNGGRGTLDDDSPCDECPNAYELYYKGRKHESVPV